MRATAALRYQLLDVLNDADLIYTLPGNPTLGAVCREMGDWQQSYINSFKTFRQDFSYRHADMSVETSVAKLRAWWTALDAELDAALHGLSEDDVQKRTIDRGGGYSPTVTMQFHIYREAILIFCGRAGVYLRALGRTMPEQWQEWVG